MSSSDIYQDVYNVFGMPAAGALNAYPIRLRRRLELAGGEIEAELTRLGITGEMPEAEQIAKRIMEQHGFKYISTEEAPDEN